MEYKSEAHLQSLCTTWFNHEFIAQYNNLILVYNNPPNGRMASLLKSMGLRRGTSDQVYFAPNKLIVWIEYKLPGRKQSDDQILFQKMVQDWGCLYAVVTSETEFQNLINKLNGRQQF